MPRMTNEVANTQTVLWHTLTIQVPKDMITFTPSGRVSVRPTLTKLHNLSKSQGKTAIRLMTHAQIDFNLFLRDYPFNLLSSLD